MFSVQIILEIMKIHEPKLLLDNYNTRKSMQLFSAI